jgi:ATP/ADP translocase
VLLPLVIAGTLFVFRVLIAGQLRGIYPVMYVGKEVLNVLAGVFLWGMAGAVLDTRQSKRIFPILIGGYIAGTAAGSFTTPLLVDSLGVENLVLLWGLAAVAVAGIIASLHRWQVGSRVAASAAGREAKTARDGLAQFANEIRQGYNYVRGSALLRAWSLAAVLFSVLWFSMLLPFSRQAAQQYPDAGQLASFFGIFQGIQTGVALLVSFFLANRLFTRFGLVNMLAGYPVIYLVGFILLVLSPAFLVIVKMRFIKLV